MLLEFLDFQCGKCSKSFESATELGIHLSTKKVSFARPKSFECFICKKYESKTQRAMRKHIKKHRVKNCNLSKCEICRKRSDWTSHLCGGENSEIQCEYCSERFKTTTKMQQHLNNIHTTKRRLYRCAKCPQFFALIFFRECHQASHSENYECNLCEKKFTNSQSLYYHKRTHSFQKCKFFFENIYYFIVLFGILTDFFLVIYSNSIFVRAVRQVIHFSP